MEMEGHVSCCASDSHSIITADMTIPVEYYSPDLSMFPDL